MHRLYSERGSAALMAAIAMVLLGGIGATTASLVSTKESTRADAVSKEQASALAQAGIEYAKNRIDMGLSPAITGKAMGVGTFTVATTPATGAVTSTGTVGAATKSYGLTTSFAKNTVDLDTSQTTIGKLTTSYCPADQTSVVICYDTEGKGKAQDYETTEICSGTLSTYLAAGATQGACAGDDWNASVKTTICHYPPGNQGNAHTITVGASAVNAHVTHHGDTLGGCPGTTTTTVTNLDTIYGVKLTNTGGLDYATAAQWTTAWTPDVLEKTIKLSVIDGNQTTVLYSNSPGYASGTQVDATDYSIASNKTNLPLEQQFNGNLTAGKAYTLTLHFSDGSTVSKTFTPTVVVAP